MKISRTKNAIRNVKFGGILRIYQIVWPFIIRTIMIYLLGVQYVGLNSLFTSILQVLNMTELGVGTAMVFSMYKPIAEDDTDTICQLLHLYKIYYRCIGLFIAVIGLAITPIIPQLIADQASVPLNITIIYWLNLINTVMTYWLFAYRNSIFTAHQRDDVISKVTILSCSITYVLQILLLLVWKNYYLYLIASILGQLLNNLIINSLAKKMYPQYSARGEVSPDIKKSITKKVMDLFTARVGGTIQNSADAVVISAFLGLTLLGKYNNYYYVMNSVFMFVNILFTSSLGGVGNSIVLDSKDKIFSDFKRLTFITEWVVCICASCMICVFQDFIRFWVGESNLISFSIVVCIVINFIVICNNQMFCLYKDGAGMWHEDRFRPLVTAIVNLALNLLSVSKFGLYGVILSTVISLAFLGSPWLLHNLFKVVFDGQLSDYLLYFFKLLLASIFSIVCAYGACQFVRFNSLIGIIIKLIISLLVSNTILWILLNKYEQYYLSLNLVKKILKKNRM